MAWPENLRVNLGEVHIVVLSEINSYLRAMAEGIISLKVIINNGTNDAHRSGGVCGVCPHPAAARAWSHGVDQLCGVAMMVAFFSVCGIHPLSPLVSSPSSPSSAFVRSCSNVDLQRRFQW